MVRIRSQRCSSSLGSILISSTTNTHRGLDKLATSSPRLPEGCRRSMSSLRGCTGAESSTQERRMR